jgi:hypothetical protein
MIFQDIILDGITCIKKFDDPLQVANGLKLRIEKDLNLNLNYYYGLHYSYTVVAL